MAETAPLEHTSTGGVEPNDAPELFPIPSSETLFDDSTVDAVPMEMTDALSPADESEVTQQRVNSSDQLPESNSQRTAAEETNQQRTSTADSAEREVEAPNNGVGSAAAETPVQTVSFEDAYQRAVSMLARGRDEAIGPGGGWMIDEPTVDACIVVKRAVKAVFDNYAGDVSRSPERPDLRLSKEEGQGYLIGSLVIGELLVSEARAVGKRVDYVVSAEDKAKQEAAKAAKEKRRAARAAEGEEAQAAALAAVEAGQAALLDARLRAPVTKTLKLPARNTIVVESKPVSAGVAVATAADKLARLRAAAARAEAAVLTADAHYTAAQRRLERGNTALSQLRSLRFDHALKGAWVPMPDPGAECDEPYQAHVREQVGLDGEMDALNARVSRLRYECNAARDAAQDARDAAELACDAVTAEERSRAAAAQAAEWAAQWAAQEEEWAREREESQARLAAARANVAAAEARLSSLKRELSPVCRPTVAAPKVFKLTGMSAADVGNIASQVSQESIGPLYWDDSAWDGYNRAVQREYGSD
jgi:hypothetical protein